MHTLLGSKFLQAGLILKALGHSMHPGETARM